MKKETYTAIILAAGRGSRMNSSMQKQYMQLNGYPLICYALHTFEKSCVDEIVLVTGAKERDYCRTQIVEKYNFRKVKKIVAGGSERYLSVYEGLRALEHDAPDLVLIHDGARPFVTQEIIGRTIDAAKQYGSGIAAMPSKDTVKIADADGFSVQTPPRANVWTIQTPQTFPYNTIYAAYQAVTDKGINDVTDDAMVLERIAGRRVKLVEGSYQNIKITTPEDLDVAASFISNRPVEFFDKN